MGTTGSASSPSPRRSPRSSSPAGWIVAGVLAIALAGFAGLQIGKRAHVDRGAVPAVATEPRAAASSAPPSAPALSSGIAGTADDPRSVQTLTMNAEDVEAAASRLNASVGTITAATWTVRQMREQRAQVGLLREQGIAELKRWSSRPELAAARKHLERAVALDEDALDYLDSIIVQQKGQ